MDHHLIFIMHHLFDKNELCSCEMGCCFAYGFVHVVHLLPKCGGFIRASISYRKRGPGLRTKMIWGFPFCQCLKLEFFIVQKSCNGCYGVFVKLPYMSTYCCSS